MTEHVVVTIDIWKKENVSRRDNVVPKNCIGVNYGAGGNCNSTRSIHGVGQESTARDKYRECEICRCQRPADRTRLHAPDNCCTNSAWTDAR